MTHRQRAAGIHSASKAFPDSEAVIHSAEGVLLLSGSLRFGDSHRPRPGRRSLSDLDMLWVSNSLESPPDGLSSELAARVARRTGSTSMHVGLKHVAPRRIDDWPAWLTNTWLLSWRGTTEPPKHPQLNNAWTFRPVTREDAMDSLATAWRYAAIAMSSARPEDPEAAYTASKVLLIISRLLAQMRSIYIASYRELLTLDVVPICRQRELFLIAYRVKTGADNDEGRVLPLLRAAREITEFAAESLPVAVDDSVQRLPDALDCWISGGGAEVRHVIAEILRRAANDLPYYDRPRIQRHLEAARAWETSHHS